MSLWILKNKVLWLVGLVVLLVALDQGSKLWAQGTLTEVRPVMRTHVVNGEPQRTEEQGHVAVRTIEVIPGVFNFKYAENPAAAFSLTSSLPENLRRPFLLIVSMLASVFIAGWYLSIKQADGLLMTAFVLIISGALGNLIDRMRLAYVIDFLDFYVQSGVVAEKLQAWFNTTHWPTFNIADSCIVVGALGVIYRTLRPLQPGREA